jgi:isocitrate lyase
VRDQNTFDTGLRQKRLMSLIHLFLIHRYQAVSVHYVSPTEDNQYQAERMKVHGIFADVKKTEVGHITMADVNAKRITQLLEPDCIALERLIDKTDPPPGEQGERCLGTSPK